MPRQSNALSRPTSVLYVEDNLGILHSTSALLELQGFCVSAAPNRAGAFALLEEGAMPDVLLCDFELQQGDNGACVIQALRQRLGRPLPAIIITGDPTALTRNASLPDKTKLVFKPPRRGEIAATINSIAGT